MATQRQLVEAGLVPPDELPKRPWLRIQGTGDATTMWYAVMRKEVRQRSGGEGEARDRSVHIGSLCLRHSDHHASLLQEGWREIPPAEIAAPGDQAM